MFPYCAIAFLTVGLLACSSPKGPDAGRVLYGNCETCHGEDGSGNQDYLAPAIAGLPEWYIEAQLEKFRDRVRGAHPEDEGGLRMGPMVQTVESNDEIQAVAGYVASLPPANPEPTLTGGSAERGRTLFATCVECHGEKRRRATKTKEPRRCVGSVIGTSQHKSSTSKRAFAERIAATFAATKCDPWR